MDEKWVGGHNTAKLGDAFRQNVSRRPSEYFGTNIFVGASTPSREEIERRHEIGIGAFLWGNDFPHHVSTWPNSQKVLEWNFAGIDPEVRQMVVCDNVRALYGF